MNRILILDNYDSFTYNLFHYFEQLVDEVVVIRPDELKIEEIVDFSALVFSPGPGLPSESKIMMELVEKFHDKLRLLGICLGHQAIGQFFGARIFNMKEVHHGVGRGTKIVSDDSIFFNIDRVFESGRYHSWALSDEDFPDSLEILARDEQDGTIMAFKHKQLDIYGLQFHPESVLTPKGFQLIKNWVNS